MYVSICKHYFGHFWANAFVVGLNYVEGLIAQMGGNYEPECDLMPGKT